MMSVINSCNHTHHKNYASHISNQHFAARITFPEKV
jgi:hypothetical protein